MNHGTRFCRASLTRTFELVDRIWSLESLDDVFEVAMIEEDTGGRREVLQACSGRAAQLLDGPAAAAHAGDR